MTDYQLHAPGRQCYATGAELKPGDAFVGELVDEAGRLVRRDFAADAWPGPATDSVGHWKGRIPIPGSKARPAIDDDALIECLGQGDAGDDFRYVVALLLMRRKRLNLKGNEHGTLTFIDTRTDVRYDVIDPGLGERELTAVQDRVFQVLGWA